MALTQRASVLPALGASLVVQERPVPTPNAQQVLIQVTAAAVNPLDSHQRYVSIRLKHYPGILGCDGAGVIQAVGSDVKDFKAGDRVFFQGNFGLDDSTFQQYVLSDAKLLGRTPPNITDDQASTLPSSLSTAISSLFIGTGIPPAISGPTVFNTPIVILGGSGSVGRSTLQLARIAGFSPIITTSSKVHAESLKALGATHIFDRTVSVEAIYEVVKASGHRLKLVIDNVSNPGTQLFAFKLLTTQPNVPSSGLRLQIVLPPDNEMLALNRARPEGPIDVTVANGLAHELPDLNAPFYAAAGKWLAEGKLVPAQVQVVGGGLANVTEALDIIAKGVSGVKLVIHPQE